MSAAGPQLRVPCGSRAGVQLAGSCRVRVVASSRMRVPRGSEGAQLAADCGHLARIASAASRCAPQRRVRVQLAAWAQLAAWGLAGYRKRRCAARAPRATGHGLLAAAYAPWRALSPAPRALMLRTAPSRRPCHGALMVVGLTHGLGKVFLELRVRVMVHGIWGFLDAI